MLSKHALRLGLMAFAVFLLACSVAWADAPAPTDDCTPDSSGVSQVDQMIISRQAMALQIKAAKQGNLLQLFPAITSDVLMCWSQIEQALGAIQNVTTSGDFFGAIAEGLISPVVNSIFASLNSTCNAALGTIKNAENSVLSVANGAICIPSLDLQFGKVTAKSFGSYPQCSGSSFSPIHLTIPPPGSTTPLSQTLWPSMLPGAISK